MITLEKGQERDGERRQDERHPVGGRVPALLERAVEEGGGGLGAPADRAAHDEDRAELPKRARA